MFINCIVEHKRNNDDLFFCKRIRQPKRFVVAISIVEHNGLNDNFGDSYGIYFAIFNGFVVSYGVAYSLAVCFYLAEHHCHF